PRERHPPTSPPPVTPPPPPPPTAAAPPPPPPPPPSEAQPPARTTGEVVAPSTAVAPEVVPSAPLPAPAPSAPLPPPVAKKKSKLPWIVAGILIFLLLSGGALAGLFFFVVKPRLDQMAAERNPVRPVENTNASAPTPV